MKKVLLLAAVGSLAASAAMAAQTGKSAATTATKAPAFVDKLGVQYIGAYYGSSIDDPMSLETPNEESGDKEGNVSMDHDFRLNYKYAPGFSFGVIQAFGQEYRKGVTAYDTVARVVTPGVITSTNFSVDNQVRVYFPTSTASQNNNLITQVRFLQGMSYVFHNPRLSFTTDFSERVYFYSDNAYNADGSSKAQTRYRFYVSPALNYQLGSKTVASMALETETKRNRGGSPFSNWDSMYTYLEPKISYDVIPAINITAYPKIPITKNVKAETTTFEIDLTATIL